METYKIAFFCWESLHSRFKVGGLAPAAAHLAEHLAARGHDVHFFTRGDGEDAAINGVRTITACHTATTSSTTAGR